MRCSILHIAPLRFSNLQLDWNKTTKHATYVHVLYSVQVFQIMAWQSSTFSLNAGNSFVYAEMEANVNDICLFCQWSWLNEKSITFPPAAAKTNWQSVGNAGNVWWCMGKYPQCVASSVGHVLSQSENIFMLTIVTVITYISYYMTFPSQVINLQKTKHWCLTEKRVSNCCLQNIRTLYIYIYI